MQKLFLLAICVCTIATQSIAQLQHSSLSPIAGSIHNLKIEENSWRHFQPLTRNATQQIPSSISNVLSSVTLATLDFDQLGSIVKSRDHLIELSIPYENEVIEVELAETNILSEDFMVVTDQSNGESVPYTPGVYYRGIVKGDDHSLVAFSFFEDEMMGVISTNNHGNIVVGKLHENSMRNDAYVIYSDRSFVQSPSFACDTYDDPDYASSLSQYAIDGGSIRTVNCVKMYYEVDYNNYVSSGSSVTSATNWITAIHNNVSTLYANEQVNVAISQIFIWTSIDPFIGTSSYAQLVLFKQIRTSFTGDIGILVGDDPGGLGGIASTINGLCSSTYKYCYADIAYSYSTAPVYSWTIEVITHEFGHLLGSYHTQSCSWPVGALDNCYAPEGTCSQGPAPTNGGTIMSYCHLTSYGINFNNGFGTYPGNAIRGAVNAATCLSTSCTGTTSNYCIASGSTSYEWIQNVQFGSFSNSSGSNSGYGNFISSSINMTAGSSIGFTLTPGFSGSQRTEYYSIWIDYNHDYDFLDAGENVYNSSGTSSAVTSNFVVPTNSSGTTRMRIAMKYNGTASSCGTFSNGEVEDYTIAFVASGINYCNSGGNISTNQWIDRVKIGSIDRHSESDGGYYNATALISNVTKGSSYFFGRSAGMSGTAHTVYWKAWADWNHDGDFTDAGEEIVNASSSAKNLLLSTITVPTNAVTGNTRLRVSMKNGGTPLSCEQFSYGEVEDYTLNILVQQPEELEIEFSKLELKLFPNPTSDQITLQYFQQAEGSTILSVYNLLGQTFIAEQTNSNKGWNTELLDVSSLNNGIYFVKISSANLVDVLQFEIIK